jgi:predicted DNA-binding transcriptional regulator AlpA
MENERILIATDKQTLRDVLNEVFRPNSELKIKPEFENDRLSKPQAARLAQISIPTLDKLVKSGKFKQYSLGSRRYFLKSEIIQALREEK